MVVKGKAANGEIAEASEAGLARVLVSEVPKAAGMVSAIMEGHPIWTGSLRSSTKMVMIGSIEKSLRRPCVSCAKCTGTGWSELARDTMVVKVRERIETVITGSHGRIVKGGQARPVSVGHDRIVIVVIVVIANDL